MLRLRPFRAPDANKIITWTSAPEEFYKWNAGKMGDFPVSEERLLEVTSERENNTKYFPLTAFDETGEVGFFIIRTPGEDDRKVRMGYVIVDPNKRGMGYGKQMLALGLRFAFDVYGANEVGLGVFDSNMPAYKCYTGLGFKETGETEAYECGEYSWTCIELSMLLAEWQQNRWRTDKHRGGM